MRKILKAPRYIVNVRWVSGKWTQRSFRWYSQAAKAAEAMTNVFDVKHVWLSMPDMGKMYGEGLEVWE